MKLPLSWLKSYVTLTLPPRELAERLTMSGSLVEQVVNSGSRFDQILVARVATLDRHPNADSLWLATLDLGQRQQTVVTGAQNLYVGVGTILPGQEKPLEGKVLRGIRSEGMVCSGRELGLSDDHAGILIIDQALLGEGTSAPDPGTPLSHLVGEWVLDLDITPNRPDCLSVYGMAREVAAVTGAALSPLPQPVGLPPASALPPVSLTIEDPDLCLRFSACVVDGVVVGPSPKWLSDRLQAAGVRAINNVVDVTNYVMLELGQPLHAYDLDHVSGPSLRVRRARTGERLTTLDGVNRELTPDMLLITDDRGPVGVAGIMGGQETEVGAATRSVLLEAATFQGRNIRRTSVALGLRSEASTRFEKGLPLTLAGLAARRAAGLVAELGGGTVRSDIFWIGDPDPEPQTIPFPLAEVERLLGVDWPADRCLASLRALGFQTGPLADGTVLVTVPWWRQDLAEAADLVEEVARVIGFDAVPETLLQGSVLPRAQSPGLLQYARARALLLASGLSEGSSPGLTSQRLLDLLRPDSVPEPWLAAVVPNVAAVADAGSTFRPVRIVNPLTPEREILRPLLLPGLIEALRDNFRAGEDRAAFFELDVCSIACNGTLPVERRHLAIAVAGDRYRRTWAGPAPAADFFDLKGVMETLLARLGVGGWTMVRQSHPLLHPGRGVEVLAGGQSLGFMGELHPRLAERWDLEGRRACVAELDFDALAARASYERAFRGFAAHPVAKRDLAIVVSEDQPAAAVLEEVRRAAKGLLVRQTLFDLYSGEPLPPGKKSLAVALELQAPDRTLADQEIDKVMERIRKTLQHRAGATFRA
jgi:phenylalanyl-tRNA synthetase beta chain